MSNSLSPRSKTSVYVIVSRSNSLTVFLSPACPFLFLRELLRFHCLDSQPFQDQMGVAAELVKYGGKIPRILVWSTTREYFRACAFEDVHTWVHLSPQYYVPALWCQYKKAADGVRDRFTLPYLLILQSLFVYYLF